MNGLRWSAGNMPECLKDYDGQFALTLWYKAVSKTFRTNCPTGRRFRSLKFHQNCFVASEAVTWLQDQLRMDRFKVNFTRDQTLALIQTMQRLERMFVGVQGKGYDAEKIQDNGALYRFCDYEAFGEWGSPCQSLDSDQICAVEIVNGIDCNSLYSRVKKAKTEKTDYVVQEHPNELYHSPVSCTRKLTSTLASQHAFGEELLARELFSSPAFAKINFASMMNSQGTCSDSLKAARGSAPRLSAHEAALEEKWTKGSTDFPGLHRRNSASRASNQFLKTGEVRTHLNRVQSLAYRSRKLFTDNAGLRDRSNEPLARNDVASKKRTLRHETIWPEFRSFDQNFGIHAQRRQNQPVETQFLRNDVPKMVQMPAFATSSLKKDLNAPCKAPCFEPVGEPEMDFQLSLIKSDSYLLQAKSPAELQLLLDFSQRLRNLLSVKDLSSVFDTSVINLRNLSDNLYETRALAWDDELFPRYVLEVLQSLVNWPTTSTEASTGSRCLTHAFDFMENYFTCVIDPLFTYKLYYVFAGVIETLRRNERQKKRDANKENALSQNNQFCICLRDNIDNQRIFGARMSDIEQSSHQNPKYSTPFSTSNKSSVSRKTTCMPCSILSDDFNAQGFKPKKNVQDGITLPRNPALESYLRRNSPAEVNTSNTSLILSERSVESNELYETALSSFDESGVDSFEQQSLGFVENTIQHVTPAVFNGVDDWKSSVNGNLRQMNSESSFDHAFYNSLLLDISEARLIEVLQLCCLLLTSLERRRIRLFLDVVRKIVWNANVDMKGVGCKCEQMACRLSSALFRCKDTRHYDPQLAATLTAFFIRHGEFIMEAPKQCEIASSGQCYCARCHSMPANSCNQGPALGEVPFTFCSQITRDEYELQSVGGTKAELRKLLDDIISNKIISTKIKNNQLKKFAKSYPDIYHERFPVASIPRSRPTSFRKSLHLLRNLRI